MFELGSTLRDARVRRGLGLDAVQRVLRIRLRYLEALEDERFDLLPGDVYARGFLREYADFLGLDGRLYVQEYDARFASHEEPPIAAVPTAAILHGRRIWPAVMLAALVAVAAAVWALGGRSDSTLPAPRPPTTVAGRPTPKPVQRPAPATKPQLARLTLTAARGDCWIEARRGSPSGPILYQRTLLRGQTVRFSLRRPMWLRLGAGSNLDASVGGRRLRDLPRLTGDVLVRA